MVETLILKIRKRRGKECEKENLHFFDVGTSGGVSGALNGACMMVGGDENAFSQN